MFRPSRFLALVLALGLAACSSSSGGGAAGGRSTSDPRVRDFMGQQLPTGGGGQWIRAMANPAPRVIYYQFAFPG